MYLHGDSSVDREELVCDNQCQLEILKNAIESPPKFYTVLIWAEKQYTPRMRKRRRDEEGSMEVVADLVDSPVVCVSMWSGDPGGGSWQTSTAFVSTRLPSMRLYGRA